MHEYSVKHRRWNCQLQVGQKAILSKSKQKSCSDIFVKHIWRIQNDGIYSTVIFEHLKVSFLSICDSDYERSALQYRYYIKNKYRIAQRNLFHHSFLFFILFSVRMRVSLFSHFFIITLFFNLFFILFLFTLHFYFFSVFHLLFPVRMRAPLILSLAPRWYCASQRDGLVLCWMHTWYAV